MQKSYNFIKIPGGWTSKKNIQSWMIYDKDIYVVKKCIRCTSAPMCIKLLSFCHHYEGRKFHLVNKLFFQAILQMNEIKVPQVSEILLS